MGAFVKDVQDPQHYKKNAFEESSTSFNNHGGYHIRAVPLGVQDIKIATSGN
jgi:hypothetical protein